MADKDPHTADTPFKTGQILPNGYRIVKILGEGSFGQVFLAEHPAQPSLNRAIKVLRRSEPGMSAEVYDDFRRRFQQEAALGAHSKIKKNPHLLEVYSFEDIPERMLMWMDYAPGGSLQSRLDRLRQEGGSLPVEECRRIAAGIAEGLAALHDPAVDVVHRDLHPGNILFDQEENGNALVADLGLAQIPGGQSMRYHSGALQPHPGHPCYRSPEHENPNRALTPASDVYALGLILFEMLTGQRYNNHEGRRPRSLRKDIPLWLDALTARMLSKEPARRPRDGAEAARLLKRGGWRIPKWVPVIAALALAGGLLSQVDWANVRWPVLPTVNIIPPTSQSIGFITATPPGGANPTKASLFESIPEPKSTPIPPSPSPTKTRTATLFVSKDPVEMTYHANGNFWIDSKAVSKIQFGKFIDQTGYATDADQNGGGHILQRRYVTISWCDDWPACNTSSGYYWTFVNLANWENPEGRGYKDSNDSVRQVSWNDARAYCEWAGKRLPTEKELSNSGLEGAIGEWVSDPSIFHFYGIDALEAHKKTPAFSSSNSFFRCAR